MSSQVGKFYDAVRNGRVSEVSSLLSAHPGLDVNWVNTSDYHYTALHRAALNNHVEVVKLLLAHPDINVNVQSVYGYTPFSYSCGSANTILVAQVLLKDPRVDVTLDDNNGQTPLWFACRNGFREMVERLIASGRDLGDIKNKKGKNREDGEGHTVLEIARKKRRREIVKLLERFIANPAQTRHEVRVKLGVLDELAAEVFALTVFLCDDLLQLKPALTTTTPASAATTRFCVIISKLPMELQMVLCHRVFGSVRQNILRKDSEAAFKLLAGILLSS